MCNFVKFFTLAPSSKKCAKSQSRASSILEDGKKLTKILSHLYLPLVLKNFKLFHFIWMKLATFRMIFSKDISMCVMCRKNKIKLTSERVLSLYGILLLCLKTYYCKCTNSWRGEWQQIFFALSSCFKTSTWTITSSIAGCQQSCKEVSDWDLDQY